jgi:hypothetical protein
MNCGVALRRVLDGHGATRGSHQFYPGRSSPFACIRQASVFRASSTFLYRPTPSHVAGVGVEIGVNPKPLCQTSSVNNSGSLPIRRRTRMSVASGKKGGGTMIVSRLRPLLFARLHVCRGQQLSCLSREHSSVGR